MNNSTAYLNTPFDPISGSTENRYSSNASFPAWPSSCTQQLNFIGVLGSNELDIPALVDQTVWPLTTTIDQPIHQQQSQLLIDSLDDIFAPWNSNTNAAQLPLSIKEEWPLLNNDNNNVLQEEPLSYTPMPELQTQSLNLTMLPPTPSVSLESNNNDFATIAAKQPVNVNKHNPMYSANLQQYQFNREITPPSSICASRGNSPSSSVSTPPSMTYFLPHQQHQMAPRQHTTYNHNNIMNTYKARGPGRRKSADSYAAASTRTYRRRASSHPSVASVVSLSAHEPVARIVDGVEYITFLYSHDRLVKEYTVRTNVDTVNLNEIPVGFRVQNAIYPRANVPREEYDGNRWEYETSCNKLGWELCWLNQEQLCGRRGLIQRAVDAYRNRHAEMRSRRVTRQEKVANGTLRKRRAKKAASAFL